MSDWSFGRRRAAGHPGTAALSVAQDRKYSARLTGPRARALMCSLLALGVLLPAWWLAGHSYRAQLVADQRHTVESRVVDLAQAVTLRLNETFGILEALRAFVVADEDDALAGGPSTRAFAGELLEDTEGVRGLAVAPDGITRWVYPWSGSGFVLGRDLAHDERPGVAADVQSAIRTHQITFSDPGDLQQGDLRAVAWLAVYRDHRFSELVAIEMDLQSILGDVKPRWRTAGLALAIRDDAGGLVYGSNGVFDADPVVGRIELPGGDWELAGIPAGGWDASIQPRPQVFESTGLGVVGLLTGLVYLGTYRQRKLKLAARERTREMAGVQEDLEKDLASHRVVEALLRETHSSISSLMSALPAMAYRCRHQRDRSIEFVTDGCAALTGYSAAELVGGGPVQYGQLIHPDDQERAWNEVQDAIREDRPFHCFYRIVTGSTQVRWVLDHGRGAAGPEGGVSTLQGFLIGVTLRPETALAPVHGLSRLPETTHPRTPLTEREDEVLRLVALGLSNQQIADVLVLSERTVRNHVSSILTKLHLESRTQAAVYAVQAGLSHADKAQARR